MRIFLDFYTLYWNEHLDISVSSISTQNLAYFLLLVKIAFHIGQNDATPGGAAYLGAQQAKPPILLTQCGKTFVLL